jgi:hypothetical protein
MVRGVVGVMRTLRMLLVAGFAILLLLILVISRQRLTKRSGPVITREGRGKTETSVAQARPDRWKRVTRPTTAQPAEQIVHEKVEKFAQSRRRLAQKLAGKESEALPPEVEAFFAAVEYGDW